MSVNEEADRLRLLIVGSACGALLRNHAEIVLAYVNRQSPQSAAHPFPQDSHSLGPRCHVFSLRGEDSGRKGFVRPERPEGGHHIGNAGVGGIFRRVGFAPNFDRTANTAPPRRRAISRPRIAANFSPACGRLDWSGDHWIPLRE